ncbi:MAG: RNA ligase family protein, partial [Tepidisphaeraceae bacterium]
SSKYEQHQLFAHWVNANLDRFDFINEGERLCGEWLAQAHGTRYALTHEPFVPFDLMRGAERAPFEEFRRRVEPSNFTLPHLLSIGPPVSIARAMEMLCDNGFHGAIDPAEGAVWRVERRGVVDFLGKYVRPDKRDGCYLPEIGGQESIWNWRPGK